MRRTALQLRRGVFAAAVALSLGFGASQALAAPAPVPQDPKCDRRCNFLCTLIGAHSGSCTPGGGCACAL